MLYPIHLLHMLYRAVVAILATNIDKWGTQYFVEVTIAANLAFFAVEKFRSHVQWAKNLAVAITAATTIQLIDQAEQAGFANFFCKVRASLRSGHTCAWVLCKTLAFISATYAGVILYFDGESCSYYFLLLYPVTIYLVLTGAGVVVLWCGCWIILRCGSVTVTKLSVKDIREQLNKLPKLDD